MEIYRKAGKVAIGSRLRAMAHTITTEATEIYALFDVDLAPKWFPVFYMLASHPEKTITELATEIGHSQPSVTKIIKEMTAAGLVKKNLKATDKRQNVVALTPKGRALHHQLQAQITAVDEALDDIILHATHNLWEALAEWEYLLEQKSLLHRVREIKKRRDSQNIQIVRYEPTYKAAFKALNEAWISTYFTMEEADYKALDHPERNILDKGGRIFVALDGPEPVGVCALLKMNESGTSYELAKMAVAPSARGKNIGWLLGQACIGEAKALGAEKIYLESNTVLKPAINLYTKLGFQKVTGHPSPYQRCNIQMELNLA
ncbi:MAG: helix-turn-helix domain-containing GNAT family N-acetyltransferase [Saprospiraceae bacterium]